MSARAPSRLQKRKTAARSAPPGALLERFDDAGAHHVLQELLPMRPKRHGGPWCALLSFSFGRFASGKRQADPNLKAENSSRVGSAPSAMGLSRLLVSVSSQCCWSNNRTHVCAFA